MGLLDDAIREHLDLKRRRGGDPAEIERAEHEALGPARRRFEEPGPSEQPATADEPLMHEDLEEDWHEALPDDPVPSGPPLAHEFDDLDAPAPPQRWEEDPFAHDDRTAPAQPPPHGLDEETSEYEVPLEHDPEDEDVLEETPDFLQDTPDHDRLWFEQRPPRDFDFDG
jgi:hypothetical protein